MAEKLRVISESLGGCQAFLNTFSAKLDYMDSITRKNNMAIDEVPDIKPEIFSKTESKIKKRFLEHLKMDPKHIKIKRGH